VGSDEPVCAPDDSQELDFELELAAVIGRTGRDIPARSAADYIAGYMVMNDWSARDLQREEMKMNLGPAKGKDFATSLGPWLVTPDELDDRRLESGRDERYDLAMTGRINGDQLTSANFKDIHFSFPQMIERASRHVVLRPGDILGSGTCGTGCILELGTQRHRWLRPGDVVEMEIERLGVLRNTVVAPHPEG
jgi:fumarylacetoacetate (FAA) hydrolase